MDGVVKASVRERLLGPAPCFVIAEAGVNHNGSPEAAEALVDAAATTGTDAVKFQTFRAELLVNPDAPKADYQIESTGSGESQYAMLKRLELGREQYGELKGRAETQGLVFLSTPFDDESADFLDALGMEAFKIGSGELTNLEFLRHVAQKGKPVILSTGMANLEEVEEALGTVTGEGNPDVVLLHCVSNYPADPAEVNLRAMETLSQEFGKPVGLSDHTMGIEVALAAVALGARVIEKHFTLDRSQKGPDHRASMEPEEMRALVAGTRKIEMALGDGCKQPTASEKGVAAVARRSLVVSVDLPAGAVLTSDVLVARRPGSGLKPSLKPRMIGRKLRSPVAAGTLLTMEMLV